MSRSSLFQELYDIIIDYLAPDKGSLRACSLVCPAFLPRSRFHLFRTLFVVRSNVLKKGPRKSVGRYIQELHVINTALNISHVLFDLPHLSTLGIYAYWMEELLVIPERMKHHLLNLTLSGVHFHSTQQFIALISSLSKLNTLELHKVDCSENMAFSEEEQAVIVPAPISLKAVTFATCSPSSRSSPPFVLLDWLAHLKTDAKLEELHAELSGAPDNLTSFIHFLRARGEHVNRLSLSWDPRFTEGISPVDIMRQLSPPDSITPALVPNLKSLCLPSLVIGSSGEATSRINPLIPDIIRRLSSIIPLRIGPNRSLRTEQQTLSPPASSFDVTMKVRVSGLHELGTEDSVEFNWGDMAELVKSGIPGRSEVKMKMLLSCDELVSVSDEETKQQWKVATEEYISGMVGVNEREERSISLVFDWKE